MSDDVVSLDEAMAIAAGHEQFGRLAEAEDVYRQILDQAKNYPAALHGLGVVRGRMGDPDEAIEFTSRAIAANPNETRFHYSLGVALNEKGILAEAIAAYRRVLQTEPDHLDALNNLGVALRETGNVEEAIAIYRRAIQIKPDFAEAHWNLAQALLLEGDLRAGWEEYEWRWRVKSLPPARVFSQPKWEGGDLRGKRVLVYAEQGFGDAIQFARFTKILQERGARVILECPKELERLFRGSLGLDQVVVQGQTPPEFDAHVALGSLAKYFAPDLESIGGRSYLKSDEQLSEAWRKKMEEAGKGIKIGLAWAGRANYRRHRMRQIELAQLEVVFRAGGSRAVFFSLQAGEAGKQQPPVGAKWADFSADFVDFAETAALVQNLDLVITVDSAVAHLAGAMGKPTWVLRPSVADWRWLRDQDGSLWYSSMRLFRQDSVGDWRGAIERVAAELPKFEAKIGE
jgi:Flp pilus assembly protein TadD